MAFVSTELPERNSVGAVSETLLNYFHALTTQHNV